MSSWPAACETWPAIASASSCASAAERVGVLGGELLAAGLLVAQALGEVVQALERCSVWLACGASTSAMLGSTLS